MAPLRVDAAEVDELVEEPLDPAGEMTSKDAAQAPRRVPEDLPLTAGLNTRIAGAPDHDLLAKRRPTRPSRT